MKITTLRVEGVRNLLSCEVVPGPALNFFRGENGAGKTSLLESLHCIAVGRSFRGAGRFAWINRVSTVARIFLVAGRHRLGLEQRRGEWIGRIDGQSVSQRSMFSELLPLFAFHPDAHSLIEGEPLYRRRLLDQGVFHVEQGYLDDWKVYRRALSQRNAVLRQSPRVRDLVIWEGEMVASGTRLSDCRASYAERLSVALNDVRRDLDVRVPEVTVSLQQGWPADETLEAALVRSRPADMDRGFTQVGPQRADLRLRDGDGLVAGRLSRGQQKILTLCMLVAQGRIFEERTGAPPIFLFDDVGSELDSAHESAVGSWLADCGWQVWMTGLHPPTWLEACPDPRMFHVERGEVTPVI